MDVRGLPGASKMGAMKGVHKSLQLAKEAQEAGMQHGLLGAGGMAASMGGMGGMGSMGGMGNMGSMGSMGNMGNMANMTGGMGSQQGFGGPTIFQNPSQYGGGMRGMFSNGVQGALGGLAGLGMAGLGALGLGGRNYRGQGGQGGLGGIGGPPMLSRFGHNSQMMGQFGRQPWGMQGGFGMPQQGYMGHYGYGGGFGSGYGGPMGYGQGYGGGLPMQGFGSQGLFGSGFGPGMLGGMGAAAFSQPWGGQGQYPTDEAPAGAPKGGSKSKKGKEGGGGKPVTQQPTASHPIRSSAGWLHLPPGYAMPEGVPPGLQILSYVDGLMVFQEVETLEAIANAIGVGYEGNNQYKISNRHGVPIYQAVEDTGFCWRCCCTQLRPVHMKVYDQFGQQVLAFQRHFRCFPCAWFECCRENVVVYYGPKEMNSVIGRVTQDCCGGCCLPTLNILGKKGDRQLQVKGPCIVGDCCGTRFDVLTKEHSKVGEVKKLPPNSIADIAKEIGTDADKFTISFPQDLKVETKATALVALLVVDLLFFEYGGNTNANADGSCTIDLCVFFCCGCPVPCRITLSGLGPNLPGFGEGAPIADQIVR